MFSCVWLHFKKCFGKYFLVFCCVLENTIENTFSTCCSHFLTFSRLPNEYIISFIPQYRNTNKTQKKKNQIQSNWEKKEQREAQSFARSRSTLRAIAIGAKARSRSAGCFARSRWSRQMILAIEALDDLGELSFPCGAIGHEQRLSTLFSFFLSLSLSFSHSLSLLRVTQK